MASVRWLPRAQAIPQVDSITVANTWAAGDTQSSTINEKVIRVTVGATVTTAAVATAIKEAINGDDITGDATRNETGDNIPEFDEVEASLFSASVVHVTGEDGVPFTLTSTETTAGTGTATLASVTAATGPNHWDNNGNWEGDAPADGDSAYLDHSDVSVLYGLSQGDIEPAAVYIAQSYTGQIGLPEINEDGGYAEYRPTYLRLGMAVLQVGAGEGNGSGRIKIDSGDDVCAVTVLNTGTSADGDLPAFLWKGTNAGNSLVQRGGSVGVAIFGGEVATLATVTVDGGDVTLGAGVTLSGAIVVNGGTLRIASKVDGSLTVNAGLVIIEGSADVDQLTIRGTGVVVYNTTGTLGGNTLVSGNGVLDFSQASGAVTVTNPIDVTGENAQVLDPLKRTGAVVFDLNESASLNQISGGMNARWTRGSVA